MTDDMNMFNRDENLKLLKYINNESYIIIHLEIYTFPVKIITDFENYCMAESVIQDIGLDNFNLAISFTNKKIISIIKELDKNIIIEDIVKVEMNDSFHIYQKIDKYDKTQINYDELKKIFMSKINIFFKKMNDFLLSPEQIINLIINEIKKVNSNKNYKHSITIDETDIFSLIIHLELNEIQIEIRLILDPSFYPFIPPILVYIKPKIKLELLFSIINLDILILQNWCPTITLEYLITNLAEQLKPIIKDYILDKTYNDFEYELMNLAVITKNKIDNKVNIIIPIPKQLKTNNIVNYWKSGTGYGGSNNNINGWSIQKYIQDQEYINKKLSKSLNKIKELITPKTIIHGTVLETYIINQTHGLTILELEKNKEIYYEIFSILDKIIFCDLLQSFINIIYDNLKNISDDKSNEFLNKIIIIYMKKYKVEIKKEIVIHDIKEKYCDIMKKLQFGNYEIPEYHYFYKNNTKLNQSGIIRVLSEISSFKSVLPINWESSIWVRVSKSKFNIFSFLISGPKDTPYENGLFEFHASFSVDYPNTVPEVIIHTTDNGKFRFNPNLYANGKVCLSLLGTWSGQDEEKWNAKTSTFLQVMVSIQSLILVEKPFFNEPGYEKEMHTDKGKNNSIKYNQNIHPNTIKLGMIDMIKNPPQGFEEVVKNHFSMKKEEIINTTLLWTDQSILHKDIIKKYQQELIDLLK